MNAALSPKSTESKILIPHKIIYKGREFEDVGTAQSIERALRDCQTQGYEAQFMPALVDARIEAPQGARIWPDVVYHPQHTGNRKN